MMKKFTTKHKNSNNKNFQTKFYTNEIFFHTYQLLAQTKYSLEFGYYRFKLQFSNNEFFSKIKYSCIFTNNSRVISKKLKINQQQFNKQVSLTNLSGFYLAV